MAAGRGAQLHARTLLFLKSEAVAYGLCMFAISMLNNMWVTFYITHFMQVAKVSSSWFYGGQLAFAVWNSVNDPVFGWMSDLAASDDGTAKGRRIRLLRRFGPLFALSFLFAWFPLTSPSASPAALNDTLSTAGAEGASSTVPSTTFGAAVVGLHFLLSICLYDGFLTVMELNYQALLADITEDDGERARLNAFAAFFSIISSLFLYPANYLWSHGIDSAGETAGKERTASEPTAQHFGPFRAYCVFIAAVAAFAFVVACRRLRTVAARKKHDGITSMESTETKPVAGENKEKSDDITAPSASKFGRQLLKQRNFAVFSVIQFLQVFECNLEKNFLPFFLATYASNISPGVRSLVVSLSFALPHLSTILTEPLQRRKGAFFVVQAQTIVKSVFSIGFAFYYLSSPQLNSGGAGSVGYMLAAFLLVARILTESNCRLSPLFLSDIIDEDTLINKRSVSMGAAVIGASAFVVKPAVSLAPMLGWAVVTPPASGLPSSTVSSSSIAGSAASSGGSASLSALASVFSSPFTQQSGGWGFGMSWIATIGPGTLLIVALPLLVSLVQLIAWRFYSLRGTKLEKMKAELRKLRENTAEKHVLEV